VEAPSLETFKARLDGALSNLVWLKLSLFTAGQLGLMISKDPFQPTAFCDSMIYRAKSTALELLHHRLCYVVISFILP